MNKQHNLLRLFLTLTASGAFVFMPLLASAEVASSTNYKIDYQFIGNSAAAAASSSNYSNVFYGSSLLVGTPSSTNYTLGAPVPPGNPPLPYDGVPQLSGSGGLSSYLVNRVVPTSTPVTPKTSELTINFSSTTAVQVKPGQPITQDDLNKANQSNQQVDQPPLPDTSKKLSISGVQVFSITDNSAIVVFDTDQLALASVKLNTGKQFIESSNIYFSTHTILLTGLKANTRYSFAITIKGEGQAQQRFTDGSYQFRTTLKSADTDVTGSEPESSVTTGDSVDSNGEVRQPQTTSPAKYPLYFKAFDQEDGVHLEWKNFSDAGVVSTKIVYNSKEYPKDLNDGEVVYEGTGESFVHKVTNDGDKFYALFNTDKAGNVLGPIPTKAQGLGVVDNTPQQLTDDLPVPPPGEMSRGWRVPVTAGAVAVALFAVYQLLFRNWFGKRSVPQGAKGKPGNKDKK